MYIGAYGAENPSTGAKPPKTNHRLYKEGSIVPWYSSEKYYLGLLTLFHPGGGGVRISPPYHIFRCKTFKTHRKDPVISWLFLNIDFKRICKKNHQFFVWGTPLRPPRKFWDLFFKNWPIDFWRWHHLLQNRFILTKWGFLQETRVQKVKIWPSYELFCFDTNFSNISEIYFKSP